MICGREEKPATPICSGCSFSALITQEELMLGNLNSPCFIDLGDEGENSSCLNKINSVLLELGAIRVEGQILLSIAAVQSHQNAILKADSSWHILYIFMKKFGFFPQMLNRSKGRMLDLFCMKGPTRALMPICELKYKWCALSSEEVSQPYQWEASTMIRNTTIADNVLYSPYPFISHIQYYC